MTRFTLASLARVGFPALLGCVLCFVAPYAPAQSADQVEVGVRREIVSRVMGERRELYVHLPESYRESRHYRRYPVLYLRDGGKFFHAFTGAVQQLTSDATPHAPEMIVVAIVETDRVRDSAPTNSLRGFTGKRDEGFKSSGGGGKFLRFLDEELVPYIDKEFSTSGFRIYCGYSFTGLSTIDAFLAGQSAFDAFLMIDPSWWWDDYVMEKRAATALRARQFDRVQLFIAASGESYPTQYFIEARDIGSLDAMLQQAKPAGLEWTFERYTGESHHSMPMRALYDGLSYIFRGYKPSLQELYVEPQKLTSRYEAVSARLGERVALPEGLLLFFAEQFLTGFNEPDKAIRYYRMSADAYPGSSLAWEGLGNAYAMKGDKQQAIDMYERALRLKPGSEVAKKALQELRTR